MKTRLITSFLLVCLGLLTACGETAAPKRCDRAPTIESYPEAMQFLFDLADPSSGLCQTGKDKVRLYQADVPDMVTAEKWIATYRNALKSAGFDTIPAPTAKRQAYDPDFDYLGNEMRAEIGATLNAQKDNLELSVNFGFLYLYKGEPGISIEIKNYETANKQAAYSAERYAAATQFHSDLIQILTNLPQGPTCSPSVLTAIQQPRLQVNWYTDILDFEITGEDQAKEQQSIETWNPSNERYIAVRKVDQRVDPALISKGDAHTEGTFTGGTESGKVYLIDTEKGSVVCVQSYSAVNSPEVLAFQQHTPLQLTKDLDQAAEEAIRTKMTSAGNNFEFDFSLPDSTRERLKSILHP